MHFEEVVRELNTTLLENSNQEEHRFIYCTDGFNNMIKFDDIIIWDSTIDPKHDKFKDFILHLKRQFNTYADTLWRLKF